MGLDRVAKEEVKQFKKNTDMKRIINGRKYDTDTATELCEYSYAYLSDFSYLHEVLYKKKTGEFFIYGEGGPCSPYHESDGRSQWGSKEIVPISEGKAIEFVEKHGTVELYEELFGEIAE